MVKKIFEQDKPEIVFHCAARTEYCSKKLLDETNIEGTRNILDACLLHHVKKAVYLSSLSVISANRCIFLTEDLPYSAANNYGASKVEAEKLAISYREKGLQIAILRPAMVYGENDTHAFSLLIDLVKKRLFPVIGKGENRFPLVYINNLIDVMELSLSNDAIYEGVYIVSDSEAVSTKQLLKYIADFWGVRSPIELPSFLMPLFCSLPFLGKRFSLFFEDKVCSIQRLRNRLNYAPRIPLCDGLRKTVYFHKQYGESGVLKDFIYRFRNNLFNW